MAAGAGGPVGVAVSVDRRQPHLPAAHGTGRCPCDQTRTFPSGSRSNGWSFQAATAATASRTRVRGADELEVPDHRDARRGGVEAEGVRAPHRSARPSRAAGPDAPEPVDEEVVADVGPAEVAGVVAVHAADQRRHVAAPVVVAVDRVVDVHLLDRVVDAGPAVTPRLPGAPLPAAVQLRDAARARPGSRERSPYARAVRRPLRPSPSSPGCAHGRSSTRVRPRGRTPPTRTRTPSDGPIHISSVLPIADAFAGRGVGPVGERRARAASRSTRRRRACGPRGPGTGPVGPTSARASSTTSRTGRRSPTGRRRLVAPAPGRRAVPRAR